MKKLHRRTVLRGAGGVSIALPFLNAMGYARGAKAQGQFPKRFIVFFSANGTITRNWTPGGTQNNPVYGPILAPLNPYKDKCLVLSNVNFQTAFADSNTNAHARGMAHCLTAHGLRPRAEFDTGVGWATGISIDQEIANKVGGETQYRSLEFGAATNMQYGGHPFNTCSYRGPEDGVPAEDNPSRMFDRLFANGPQDPFDRERAKSERKSVLDFVLSRFNKLYRDVDGEDKIRLEAHAAQIRDLELRIDLINDDVCDPGERPTVASQSFDAWRNFPQIVDVQTKMLARALACDLTRVAMMQNSGAQSGVIYTWLGVPDGEQHHFISHEGDGNAVAQTQLTDINTWLAQRFANFIGEMDSIQEGDGTLLDHSCVMWLSEIGYGNNHSKRNIPYVLAGGLHGTIKTGQHITLPDGGRPHGELYVAIQNAMGIPTTTFGRPEHCNGPLSEILV